MAITRGKTETYVLPNGRIDFNLFPLVNGAADKTKAKGFRYLGSCKELTLTQENETLEHKSSECGVNKTDLEIVISSKLTGSFTSDNINSENLALFFAGDVDTVVQAAATGKTEVLQVFPALGYRLGVTQQNPNGIFAANITKIQVFNTKADADSGANEQATLTADVDYEFTKANGYLMIGDKDSTTKIKAKGSWIKVTYDLEKAMREVVISKGQNVIGELLFRGCNAYGENRQYWLPKIRLSANGDLSLKGGEEWQSLGFTITALEDAASGSMLYVNGQPTTLV
nr:MAG TPA: major tail protein [Caudoviricetes sp.]